MYIVLKKEKQKKFTTFCKDTTVAWSFLHQYVYFPVKFPPPQKKKKKKSTLLQSFISVFLYYFLAYMLAYMHIKLGGGEGGHKYTKLRF